MSTETPTEYIVCAICGKKLQVIGSHSKVHGLTLSGYKEKFPDAELYSKQILKVFAQAGYRGNIGRPTSEETKRKIGNKNRGQKRSEETKKKIRGMRGQKHSEEAKEKMRRSQRTRWENFFKSHPNPPPKPIEEKEKKIATEAQRKKTSERMKKQWADGKMKNVLSPMARKKRADGIRKHWLHHPHPQKGIPRSEETKQKMRDSHRRGLSLPTSKRRERHSETRKRMWLNYTDDEKASIIKKILLSAKKKPNNQEKLIQQYISVYGFRYNRSVLLTDNSTGKKYVPDFIHDTYPLIIEFDGFLGHNIESPYVTEDMSGREETRDRVYKEHGYSVFCIPENDTLNKYIMDYRIIEKIEKWLLDYQKQLTE